MFRTLKNMIPHMAAIVAGSVTFKVLNDANVDDKVLIGGTALAAGVTDIAAAASLNLIEKCCITTTEEVLDEKDDFDVEFDDLEFDSYTEDKEEEDQELADIGEISSFVKVVKDDFTIFTFGSIVLVTKENIQNDGSSKFTPVSGFRRCEDHDIALSKEEAEYYCETLETIIEQNRINQIVQDARHEESNAQEGVDGESATEEIVVEEQGGDNPTTVENVQIVAEPPLKVVTAEELAANEGVESVTYLSRGIIIPESDTSASQSPAEEFAEQFVAAAEESMEAVDKLLDEAEKSSLEGKSVLEFAQGQPTDSGKAKRNQRRNNTSKKKNNNGGSRLERRFK